MMKLLADLYAGRPAGLAAYIRQPIAVCWLFLLASLSSNAAHVQTAALWQQPPQIVVVGPSGDARQQLVDEAISFWNKTFQEIGVCYELGPAVRLDQPVPEEELKLLSRDVVDRSSAAIQIPAVLLQPPGQITIFLSTSDFVSFTFGHAAVARRVIGIRGLQFVPMSMPNVARNVIAHLLGLALGLNHNSDPATLMCGRPMPARFVSLRRAALTPNRANSSAMEGSMAFAAAMSVLPPAVFRVNLLASDRS
jgi:hypothetical protein